MAPSTNSLTSSTRAGRLPFPPRIPLLTLRHRLFRRARATALSSPYQPTGDYRPQRLANVLTRPYSATLILQINSRIGEHTEMAKGVNKVFLLGNVGKDPEIRSTAGGMTVASFSLATAERTKGQDGKWADKTEWHNIVCFQRTAEGVRD